MRQRTALLLILLWCGVTAFAPSRRGLPSLRPSNQILSPSFFSSRTEPAVSSRIPTTVTPTARHHGTTSTTSLRATPGFAVAAITGAISGGLFAGGLHAVAGAYYYGLTVRPLARAPYLLLASNKHVSWTLLLDLAHAPLSRILVPTNSNITHHIPPTQAPITWPHCYRAVADNAGSTRVEWVRCGGWDTEFRPRYWVSWPLP